MKIAGAKPPEPGHAIRLMLGTSPVAVFNVGGQLLGIDAACTHVGGPLDRGPVSGTTVTCPLHGSQFDLHSGAVIRGPATRAVKTYRVRAVGDGIEVDAT